MTALDAIVGITPGGTAPLLQVTYTTQRTVHTAEPTTILEQCTASVPNGSTDFPGAGQGPTHPFGLDRHFLLWTPNAAGGYDVKVLP